MNNHFPLGKSGCSFEMVNDHTIRKYSRDGNYNLRLLSQAIKQMNFGFISDVIKTPAVTTIHYEKKAAWFEMDYVDGTNIFESINTSNRQEFVEWFIENLMIYIDYEISKSVEMKIDISPITKKLKFINGGKRAVPIPTSNLLCGTCHGDLTIANMIYFKSKIYLIDFLDTYPETPIYDIIKLRQDTKYLWSLFLMQSQSKKMKNVMTYMDDRLTKKYRDIINSEWYIFLENYSLLRILPYVTRSKELQFLNRILK